MLRDALTEIRLHPGRFVATLIAIAISVGFLAAISVVINTEERALSLSQDLNLSQADVVVDTGSLTVAEELYDEVAATAGVREVMITRSSSATYLSEESTATVQIYTVPEPAFVWSALQQGRWPDHLGEVALSTHVADQLGVTVGDEVEDAWDSVTLTVVGTTDDPRSLAGGAVYVTETPWGSTYLAIQSDGDPAGVVADLSNRLPGTVSVDTTEDHFAERLASNTFGVEIFKYLLYVFAAIAMVVGIIIISNTFTILVTQRRRQIALLRAVGASTGQVRGRLILEALVIGLVGSLMGLLLGMGVAVAGGLYTGSLYWGLVLDPTELGVAIGVGVLVTFLSMLGPSLMATRVPPIEALQPVPSASESRKISAVRMGFSVLLGFGGVALVVYSRTVDSWHLAWAIPGAILLSFALLIGAVLYIPPLLRLLGNILGFAGPTLRLAAKNAARNPRRTAATSVALMLAVGLVVTLQVAISTTRSTAVSFLDETFPIDMIIATPEGDFDPELIDRLLAMPAVADIGIMESKSVEVDYMQWRVADPTAAIDQLGLADRVPYVERGRIVVSEGASSGGTMSFDVAGGTLDLEVSEVAYLGWRDALVHADDFAALPGEVSQGYGWVELVDGVGTDEIMDVLLALDGVNVIDGAAIMSSFIEQVVNVLMLILTALLGVAVLIALVGVANTLGLSVLERQRESALLRALGMQRAGLKWMLFAEAMLIAGLAVVIGVAGGAFFGWLGVNSTLAMINAEAEVDLPTRFSVDFFWTAGLVLVCVAAAALASVLPGRRAAKATPTEALAAE